jgi:hypothetical protein
MKIIRIKKQLIPALHLLFWFVSLNFWNVIFNPGVESTGVIEGLEVGWDFILLMNFIFLIYCSMPLIWLVRKARLWIKIPVTILFLAPIVYVIIQGSGQENDKDTVEIFMEFFVKNFLYVLTFHLTIVAAVYYNLKILIPRYLTQSKFVHYLLYLIALIGLTAVVNFALFDYCIDLIFPSLYFISYFRIWELVLIVKAYLVVSILVFLIWQYVGMLIANREKAQNELSALKAQINPHFLFNNLNTIYSLASKRDEHTTDVILQLSDFLRYVLYDTASEFIPLEKEVEIIRTYVELQKARVNPEVTSVILTIEGNFANVEITPLLLLPLAENCFKHGIGKNPGKIELYIGFDGKQLLFKTRNAIALRENTGGEVNGGIGIKNVEKRLYLIYPERHSLEYSENEGIFNLEMRIDLG